MSKSLKDLSVKGSSLMLANLLWAQWKKRIAKFCSILVHSEPKENITRQRPQFYSGVGCIKGKTDIIGKESSSSLLPAFKFAGPLGIRAN